MERYKDPNDSLNDTKYHTGKQCIEPSCERPAGTHWSPLWCQPCNAARMSRIGATLRHELARLQSKVPANNIATNVLNGPRQTNDSKQ